MGASESRIPKLMSTFCIEDPHSSLCEEGKIRFACFSDTHTQTPNFKPEFIVPCDVLIHAGDFSNTGTKKEVDTFRKWLLDYPAKHRVVIAGNHDITFQPDFYEKNWRRPRWD